MAQPPANNLPLALFPMVANMNIVNAQAQNQALEANNQANAQLLQALEKIQAAFQALAEENARLNAEVQTLKAQIKTECELNNQEIIALKNQVNAVRLQSADTAQKGVDTFAKTVSLEQKSATLNRI